MSFEVCTLDQLKAVCNQSYPAESQKGGLWQTRWKIDQIFRRLLGFEKEDTLKLCSFLNHYFRAQELKRDKFTTTLELSTFEEIQEAIEVITERLRMYLDEEKAKIDAIGMKITHIKELIAQNESQENARQNEKETRKKRLQAELKILAHELKEEKKSATAHHAIGKLKRNFLAYKYRGITEEQLIEQQARENRLSEMRDWLTEKLHDWKGHQYPPLAKGLSDDESKKLEKTLLYPELIELFHEHEELLHSFLAFVFRNTKDACETSVEISVQFPVLQEQLTKAFLDKRVRRLKNKGLYFVEFSQQAIPGVTLISKDVRLLINGQYESLLDQDNEITFDNDTTRTIAELIEDEFGNKNKAVGRFEYLKEGVMLVDPQYPRVDLHSCAWWKELLPFEELSRAELLDRYKDKLPQGQMLQEGEGLIVVKASRQHANLRTDNNHGWFEVFVETKPGIYSGLPLGKLAAFFPQGTFDLFFFIFATQPATISYPDENEFYYHRETCELPLVANKAHLERFFEKVRLDLLKAKERTIFFQSQGNNCSTWVQETVDHVFCEKKLPRLFDLDVLETTGPFPVNHIISTLNAIKSASSAKVANFARVAFCTLFGAAWRGYDPTWELPKITWMHFSGKALWKKAVRETGKAVDVFYKIALYVTHLALHILFGIEDPAIRLVGYDKWLEGKLSLPAQFFKTAGLVRKAFYGEQIGEQVNV